MQQPSTASQTQHPAVQMTASLASAPVAALITLLLFVGWGAAGSVHAQSPLPASVATPTSDAASDTVSTPSATPRSPLRRPVGRDAAGSVETGPATVPRTGLENVPGVLRPTVRAGGQEQPSTPPLPPPPDVDDPNLIERFRSARYRVLAHRGLGSDGRQAAVLAPVRLPAASDTLRPDPTPSSSPSPPASFPIDEVHALRRLERGWFREKFAETDWSFLGSGRYFTFFDTTRTQDLRARLQAQFGAPTLISAAPARRPSRRRTTVNLNTGLWSTIRSRSRLWMQEDRGTAGSSWLPTSRFETAFDGCVARFSPPSESAAAPRLWITGGSRKPGAGIAPDTTAPASSWNAFPATGWSPAARLSTSPPRRRDSRAGGVHRWAGVRPGRYESDLGTRCASWAGTSSAPAGARRNR